MIPAFYSNFLFFICSHFELDFIKPTLFSFGYEYYASAHMVKSQLNHQNYFIAEAPSNPLLNLPFNIMPWPLPCANDIMLCMRTMIPPNHNLQLR